MKQFGIGYLLIFFVLSFNAEGQKPLKHFNVDNGLLSSETYQVVQDHKGYIWITTDGGVSKFNGNTFKHFSSAEGLTESTVLELFEDSKNRMWFVMITNELAYVENDTIHIFPYNDSISLHNDKERFPLKKSFYVDSLDNVYVGLYFNDIFQISSDGEFKKVIPKGKGVNTIFKIEDKYMFTAKKRTEKKHSKDKQELNAFFEVYHPFLKDSLMHFRSIRTNARTILEEYNGKILYTDYNKLFVFNEDGTYNEHYFEHDILWLSKDKLNNLWFGFHYGGAVVYEDLSFTQKKYHILPNSSVSSVLCDNEGGYWFSTLNNGVYLYSSLAYKNYGQDNGISVIPITEIESYKNSIICAGVGDQYYTITDNQVFTNRINLDIKPANCKLMSVYGDSIFMSFNLNPNYLIYQNSIKDLRVPSYATAILPYDDISLFFHRRSIKALKDRKISSAHFDEFNEVYDAIKYNDTLAWLVTNNGLFQYDLNRKNLLRPRQSSKLTNRSNSISKDKEGIVWFTSKNRILSISDSIVNSFTSPILRNSSISCHLVIDSLLFVGTNNGIFRFKKIKDSVIVESGNRIHSGSGLLNNEVYDIDYAEGYIYAATSKGVSSFPVHQQKAKSPLYIDKVLINGKDTAIFPYYELSYNQNYIDFQFVALNFQRNEPIVYQYKLEGIDRSWRETKESKIQYALLPPGKYSFQVKAINSFGIVSELEDPISITIHKAFYNTIWFQVLVVLVFLLLVTAIFLSILRVRLREANKRYLVEQKLNQSRQQALSAQMNPHFIYNSLNSVQSYILKNEKVMASEYLSKLGRLMRNILNNSQNQSITLKEEFDALEKYMEMEQLRFKGLFNYKFNICSRINMEAIHVPPLIIQPFVENAIQHGLRLRKKDGELLVDACMNDGTLRIIIQDNGVGIDHAKAYNSKYRKDHKSYGTEITHKRLKLLEEMNKEKVTLSVSKAYPEDDNFPGTKVELNINLS